MESSDEREMEGLGDVDVIVWVESERREYEQGVWQFWLLLLGWFFGWLLVLRCNLGWDYIFSRLWFRL